MLTYRVMSAQYGVSMAIIETQTLLSCLNTAECLLFAGMPSAAAGITEQLIEGRVKKV